MTPKEKAKELYCKYYDEFNFDEVYNGSKKQSKECAIIVIEELKKYSDYEHLRYWDEVLQELEQF
jgi:hypothetical protein